MHNATYYLRKTEKFKQSILTDEWIYTALPITNGNDIKRQVHLTLVINLCFAFYLKDVLVRYQITASLIVSLRCNSQSHIQVAQHSRHTATGFTLQNMLFI